MEYFRTAHEEMLSRVKQRDGWIKVQLAAQVVVAALASGIKLLGAEPTAATAWVAPLALPVALVLCLLVSVEDRLIGHLAKYLGSFPPERSGAAGEAPMNCFNASDEVKTFARKTLPFRTAALTLVFLCIPAVVAFAPFASRSSIFLIDWITAIANIAVALIILCVIILNHRFRQGVALDRDGVLPS